MKKILLLLIVGSLVLCGLGASAFSQNKQSSQNMGDELDQYQEIMTEYAFIPIGQIPIPDNPLYIQVAQSFIPTKEVLTRVELYIAKNSTATYPLKVSIREELTDEDLTYIDIDPNLVPTEEFDWVEINFDDILVTTGLTYYIVTLTENATDNFYGWGANNMSESYPFGCAWLSYDGGDTWTNQSVSSNQNYVDSKIKRNPNSRFDDVETWDMCFRTYGRDNQAPGIPDISGPTSGKAGVEYIYKFVSIDPEEDDIYYFVDWGDGTNTGWIGPFDSGEEITQSHVWSERGTYTIKAKARDVYGAESDWGTLSVTMPLNLQVVQQIRLRFNQLIRNLIYNLKPSYQIVSI